MPVDVGQTLRQVLTRLQQEKQRIDRQITALETAMNSLNASGTRSNLRLGQPPKTRTRGRKRMTLAARRAASRRMTAYWAKRRVQAKAKKQ
jgi:hypothetical protein